MSDAVASEGASLRDALFASAAADAGGSHGAFDPAEYGRTAASAYDDLYDGLDPTAAVEAITALARGRRVLEFGIGTGRVALPLAARGLEVHGIEGSPEMVEVLRRKTGGAALPVVVGDFSTSVVAGTFGVVALLINTIYAVPSQDAQVAVFRNAARHLDQGGHFIVEAWVPDVGSFRNGTAVRPVQIEDGRLELEVARIDVVAQTMRTNKVHLSNDRITLIPANHRYAWPAEMDLMARLAGMRLQHRWESWARSPYGQSSTGHVSVWTKVSPSPW